jgi:hypothetical protein
MPEEGNEFVKSRDLAERLYELQTQQTTQLMQGQTALAASMSDVKTSVALIQSNTKGLPERVLALENLRYKAMALVAAGLFILWAIQTAVQWFRH